MWNKADIRAVLLSNETSTAPFPCCLQNVADISRITSIVSFRRRGWSQQNFSEREAYRITKVKMCLVKYEDYKRNIFLASDVGVAVLVRLSSLLQMIRTRLRSSNLLQILKENCNEKQNRTWPPWHKHRKYQNKAATQTQWKVRGFQPTAHRPACVETTSEKICACAN